MKLRPHAFRAAAVAAVLAPLALSVAAHAIPDRMTPVPAADRSPLAFGEYLVNLGRLPEGRPAAGLFRFTNAGSRALTILGFEPSCGCLKPRLDKSTFDPGEIGAFLVQADTAGEASDRGDLFKQHFVDVRYDAGAGERTARVHVKFVLPARHVTVEPRSLLVYQYDATPTTREITVTDRRVPPVTITGVTSLSPHIAVESRPAESPADPTRATIAVTIPGTLHRNVDTRIAIRTDDPEQPLIQIPIVVRVRSELPATVRGLPLSELLELAAESATGR